MTTDTLTAGYIAELPKTKPSGRRAGISRDRGLSSNLDGQQPGSPAF
jgi:hypothetical protein